MKLKHVGMIVVSVLAMSSAAVSAAEGDESVTTTVNGGVIHFKGEVVNAACAMFPVMQLLHSWVLLSPVMTIR